MIERLKLWARNLKRDVMAIWIAARDPRIPWSVKLLAAAAAAYALSPIDLIPDVVPVLGYLDDLLIVPAGIWLVARLIPTPLLDEFRAKAVMESRPKSWPAALAIIGIWLICIGAIWQLLLTH